MLALLSDNREELVTKRRHYLDGDLSPEEKGKGKRKKLKNGRYSSDDDDVVSLLSQCTSKKKKKKKKRKNTGLDILMELEKQGIGAVITKNNTNTKTSTNTITSTNNRSTTSNSRPITSTKNNTNTKTSTNTITSTNNRSTTSNSRPITSTKNNTNTKTSTNTITSTNNRSTTSNSRPITSTKNNTNTKTSTNTITSTNNRSTTSNSRPITSTRKAKGMFGLKVKKKKKVNTDLVLANKGALPLLSSSPPRPLILSSPPLLSTSPPLHFTSLPHLSSSSPRCPLNTRIQEGDSKPQSFQVAVNITEARQLMGENIDPSVVIEIGDERKQTSVKEGTNAPFYNEYFVFDFFAHQELFFDKVIRLSVVHCKMLRSFSVGSFKLDVGTVYRQPGHQFTNKWAVLTDPSDLSTGVKGYVKCDISVSGKGDATPPGQKASDADEQIEK
ncbi:Fer-1-like protein 6 [Merluccius polli]|uniref:Fer-1-like protein 6 n=1 Tax=Merluccius polli TaxID=89951 RepID=A0AA47PD86_MERPO|nr:Fer-1-like protein 6 [Merluccius polli]